MISVSILVDISLASNVTYCCHVTPLDIVAFSVPLATPIDQLWGNGARAALLELAYVHQYNNFCLHISPVGDGRLVVNTRHFTSQPQIHSRLTL